MAIPVILAYTVLLVIWSVDQSGQASAFCWNLHFCYSHWASCPKDIQQMLQIQEVHPGLHSSECNFLPSLFFIPSFASRTPDKPEDRVTFLLSSRSSPIIWRHSWAPWPSVCACYPQVLTKVPRTESGTFWFPWTNSHDSTTIGYLLSCSTIRSWNQAFPRDTEHKNITKFHPYCVVFLEELAKHSMILQLLVSRWVFSASFQVRVKAVRPSGE